MQDKSAGARLLAQECLSGLIAAGTVQPSRVRTATRDFQPAVMRQLKPALEKVLESSGVMRRSVSLFRAVDWHSTSEACNCISLFFCRCCRPQEW